MKHATLFLCAVLLLMPAAAQIINKPVSPTDIVTSALAEDPAAARAAMGAAVKDGAETLSGAKSFSGQVELTGQTAPNASSAMTRALTNQEALFASATVRELCYGEGENASATSGSGSVGLFGPSTMAVTGSTTASAWQRYNWGDVSISGYPWNGGGPPCSLPMAVGVTFLANLAADANSQLIFGYLNAPSSALPAPSSVALTDRGFGFRIYYSTANARYEVALFAHNGSGMDETSTALPVAPGNRANMLSFVVSTSGSGTVRLYAATANLTNPSRTPLLSIGGAATTGVYNYRFTTGVANGASSPASAPLLLLPNPPKIAVNQSY